MPLLTQPKGANQPQSNGDLFWLAIGIGIALIAVLLLDTATRAFAPGPRWLVQLVTILSLATGVAVLVLGVRIALRRSLRWWRLMAIPALLMGAFWSVVPVGIAWVSTHPRHAAPSSKTPTSVGLRYRDVAIPTTSGARLAAWYVEPKNGAVVILLPGAMSTKDSLLEHAKILAKHGFGLLLVDPRGMGGSTGEPMEYGWWGTPDTHAVDDWLGEHSAKAPRVAVLGLSMGGEQALTAAATDRRISAVVAEGATHRTYEDVYVMLRGPEKVLGVPQYRVLYGVADWLTPARPPVPLVAAVRRVPPRRILLMTTSEEQPYGRLYAAAARSSATLWSPASREHTKALEENPAEWERRVVGFLDDALGANGVAESGRSAPRSP
jgi:pimeloyl-ACP methyl ester carboxylesterase